MSAYLDQLDKLYSEYLHDIERITREHFNLRGAFGRLFGGSAAGPGSDSCNDRFSDGIRQLIDSMVADCPSADEAAEVIDYVISPQREQNCSQGARLMMQAVHGYLLPLVEFLSPEDAKEIHVRYSDLLAVNPPLPVQKQLAEDLGKRANIPSDN